MVTFNGDKMVTLNGDTQWWLLNSFSKNRRQSTRHHPTYTHTELRWNIKHNMHIHFQQILNSYFIYLVTVWWRFKAPEETGRMLKRESLHTVECRYNAVRHSMIMRISLQRLRQSYGVSFERNFGKIDHVMTAPQCICLRFVLAAPVHIAQSDRDVIITKRSVLSLGTHPGNNPAEWCLKFHERKCYGHFLSSTYVSVWSWKYDCLLPGFAINW